MDAGSNLETHQRSLWVSVSSYGQLLKFMKTSEGPDLENYVIAGGSSGIGLELVRLLAPTAARIDVW